MDLRLSVRNSSAASRAKQKKRRGDQTDMVDSKGKKRTKIVVRMLHLEANKKELRLCYYIWSSQICSSPAQV